MSLRPEQLVLIRHSDVLDLKEWQFFLRLSLLWGLPARRATQDGELPKQNQHADPRTDLSIALFPTTMD